MVILLNNQLKTSIHCFGKEFGPVAGEVTLALLCLQTVAQTCLRLFIFEAMPAKNNDTEGKDVIFLSV